MGAVRQAFSSIALACLASSLVCTNHESSSEPDPPVQARIEPAPETSPASPSQPAPTPEPVEEDTDENPLAPKLDTEVPNEWRCPVDVEAVLADEHFRGHPNTPAHVAWVNGLSPEDYQMYNAESHGESYRSCSYRVKVAGGHWRYTATWSTTFVELSDDWCEDAKAHVAADIQRTTQGCSDLHRGAYYGSDLTPL